MASIEKTQSQITKAPGLSRKAVMGTVLPGDISPSQVSDRRLCIAIFRLGAALLLPEILEISQTDTANSIPAYPALVEIGGQTLEKGIKYKGPG